MLSVSISVCANNDVMVRCSRINYLVKCLRNTYPLCCCRIFVCENYTNFAIVLWWQVDMVAMHLHLILHLHQITEKTKAWMKTTILTMTRPEHSRRNQFVQVLRWSSSVLIYSCIFTWIFFILIHLVNFFIWSYTIFRFHYSSVKILFTFY